jgi:hypothetical protein
MADLRRAQGDMLKIDGLNKSDYISMFIEIIVNLAMPYPFEVNSTYREFVYVAGIYTDKRIDTVLITLMFYMRMYHFFRPVLHNSYFMGNRSLRICRLYGFNCDMNFSIKCILKEFSFSVTTILYFLATIYFGAMLRFNEQQAYI